MAAAESPTRAKARYSMALPIVIELSNGLFRRPDAIEALLVDLSHGGAAIIVPNDARLKVKKRYRVWLDDHAGIIRTGSIVPHDDTCVRVGVRFERLGLELQELVVDTVQGAQARSSRLSS
ncbi:MAG: PilZ domain-containing protein [Acidimicrobiales bacterium]|nr:PilZ domain-containing protein [Acidimicrobiales bacterium]RZV46332.1 MAG: PilZ domain-containing protein [Acidimicrobiales bacterium]